MFDPLSKKVRYGSSGTAWSIVSRLYGIIRKNGAKTPCADLHTMSIAYLPGKSNGFLAAGGRFPGRFWGKQAQ